MRSASSANARSQTARAGTAISAMRFERLAVSPRVRDRGVARDARGHALAVEESRAREQLLDTLVHVAEPLFEPQHLLPDDGETEVAGLDDSRVHWADGNLVDAVACDTHERVVVRAELCGRHGWRCARGERPVVRGPRGVPQPRAGVGVLRRAHP